MVNIRVLDNKGEVVEKIALDSKVFGIEVNNPVMFDLVMAIRSMNTAGNHKVKTKAEVSGGGKKPWKQKGTGRARQGSIRSPQWRGGGVVFGPTLERNYKIKLNKKVWNLGYRSAFSDKCKNDEILILKKIKLTESKTRKAAALLKQLKMENKKILFITKEYNHVFDTATNNIPNVECEEVSQVNIIQIMHADVIITDKEAIKFIEQKLIAPLNKRNEVKK